MHSHQSLTMAVGVELSHRQRGLAARYFQEDSSTHACDAHKATQTTFPGFRPIRDDLLKKKTIMCIRYHMLDRGEPGARLRLPLFSVACRVLNHSGVRVLRVLSQAVGQLSVSTAAVRGGLVGHSSGISQACDAACHSDV